MRSNRLRSLRSLRCAKGCPAPWGGVVHFLTGYVIVHFSDEESMMRERGYPGIDGHQQEHHQFRERLKELRISYVTGMRDEVISEAVWLAADWFIGHIKRADLVMAEHLRRGGHV